MRFLYPFALLGLIAIPILIIIYIIRSKYKEVTSPTTYIWEVAAKMFKRKNPLSRFEHLLALIVQMTAIAILSIALAHPVFTLKEAADDIVFVLDGSSSMSLPLLSDALAAYGESSSSSLLSSSSLSIISVCSVISF